MGNHKKPRGSTVANKQQKPLEERSANDLLRALIERVVVLIEEKVGLQLALVMLVVVSACFLGWYTADSWAGHLTPIWSFCARYLNWAAIHHWKVAAFVVAVSVLVVTQMKSRSQVIILVRVVLASLALLLLMWLYVDEYGEFSVPQKAVKKKTVTTKKSQQPAVAAVPDNQSSVNYQGAGEEPDDVADQQKKKAIEEAYRELRRPRENRPIFLAELGQKSALSMDDVFYVLVGKGIYHKTLPTAEENRWLKCTLYMKDKHLTNKGMEELREMRKKGEKECQRLGVKLLSR